MNPEVLRAFFRAGIFIAGVALILMLAVPRASAEFVVSTCSLGIGLTLIGWRGAGELADAAVMPGVSNWLLSRCPHRCRIESAW